MHMDQETAVTPDFMDMRTRAEFCELCGDAESAERWRNLSLQVAREVDLTCYAYQLLWRERLDDAIEILEYNTATHPDSWNAWHSLGEAYELLGDFDSAVLNYRIAASLTDEYEPLVRIGDSLERMSMAETEAS